MSAATKEIHFLQQWFDDLHRVDPELLDEIFISSAPTRLFRQGAGVEADLALQPAARALSRGLLQAHRKLEVPALMRRFYKNFDVVASGADVERFAYNELIDARAAWQEVKRELAGSKVEGAKDFVLWFDRDVEELTVVARREGALARGPKPTKAAPKSAATAVPSGATSKKEGRKVYDLFVETTAGATPRAFPSLARAGIFLRRKDIAIWTRIAEAAKRMTKSSEEELASKIQGIIGEALALRHPWVSHELGAAVERAQALVSKLGKEWSVVFVEAESYASKTAGSGLGQLYDSSIWIVKKGKTLEAAPVWVLEVKSGKIAEAPEQIRKDFARELGSTRGATVRLPMQDGSDGEFAIKNLRGLLEKQVDLEAAGLGDGSTQRLLVMPRAPTDAALVRKLPRGVAIDFIPALMSKGELNDVSRALAKSLKKTPLT
jgi:hypothetical protein